MQLLADRKKGPARIKRVKRRRYHDCRTNLDFVCPLGSAALCTLPRSNHWAQGVYVGEIIFRSCNTRHL